jgi:hypothetical protein
MPDPRGQPASGSTVLLDSRSESHLGGQRREAGEVAADVLDEVFTTPRTHDRATVERIGGEFWLGAKPGPA